MMILRPIVLSTRLMKARIKAHYRHLPNGHIIWIESYEDKRKAAQENPSAFRGKVVHADEKSTTIVNHKNQLQTFPHSQEMGRHEIHAHLNRAMPVDEHLAAKIFKHEHGITDFNRFFKLMAQQEQTQSKPRFKNPEEAKKHFEENELKPLTKQLRETHGDVTTLSQAYTHKDPALRKYFDKLAEDKTVSDHERGLARMAREHAGEAKLASEVQLEQARKAMRMRPEDMPEINGISKNIKFFSHQAMALAKMNVLKRSAVDVDMGGGKGLILPADALNLMGQGKIKKPLIVMPLATVDQNAAKIVDEYTQGKVNVFKITNETIKKHYGGDVDKMIADIQKAPSNTVFLASYDAFTYRDKDAQLGDEPFDRARRLSGAGFDYAALDESHNIKNIHSDRFKALSHLSGVPFKRTASGTLFQTYFQRRRWFPYRSA